MSIEVMKQALDCLQSDLAGRIKKKPHAISALRQAIEQAEKQEPVGEVIDERGNVDYVSYVPSIGTKLYTTPQPQQAEKPFYKVEGPLHVVCQCDKCKAQPQRECEGCDKMAKP